MMQSASEHPPAAQRARRTLAQATALVLGAALVLSATARGESITFFYPDPITGSPIAATDEQGVSAN